MKTKEEIIKQIAEFHHDSLFALDSEQMASEIYDMCSEHFNADPQEGFEKRWVNIYISEDGNFEHGHFLYCDEDLAIKHSDKIKKPHATVPVWIPKLETEREKLIRELREWAKDVPDGNRKNLKTILERAAKALEDEK